MLTVIIICLWSSVLFLAILCEFEVTQHDNNPGEDLARLGYRLNVKVKFVKHCSAVLPTYLNHVLKPGDFS
jgi:hypothetical protein